VLRIGLRLTPGAAQAFAEGPMIGVGLWEPFHFTDPE
jgi:hypothetical protein